MGTVQWDETNESEPLTFFIGASSGKAVPAGERKSVQAVQFETAHWDGENGTFLHRPVIKEVEQGDLLKAEMGTTFSLSSRSFEDLHSRRYTSRTLDTADTVVGNVTVRYPMIYARGEELVREISAAVYVKNDGRQGNKPSPQEVKAG